jgi:hypothetical protein
VQPPSISRGLLLPPNHPRSSGPTAPPGTPYRRSRKHFRNCSEPGIRAKCSIPVIFGSRLSLFGSSNMSFSMNPSPARPQIRSPGHHGMVTLAPQTAGATSRIVVLHKD